MLLLTITFALSVVIVPLAADPHLELSEFDATQEYSSPCKTHEVAFGLQSGKISNSQITSSTAYRPRVAAVQGRLDGAASWSARVRNKNQWIQIDLGRDEVVTAIATQGRANANQWVTSYYVSYSLDGKVFVSYKTKGGVKVFRGNRNRNSIVKNILSPPVTARYVRIHPVSWARWISMRIELYGCSREYTSPCNTREVAFGVESGKIPNSQITSSTAYRPRVAAMKGRLNGVASWSARVRNRNQWIQIDLGRDEVVTAIATQGRANLNQWVTSYYVSYSLDGKVFVSYKTKGVVKVFRGNRNRNSIVKNILSPPINARYVRIHPVSWARWISMRIELYGCNREYTSTCNTREVAFGVESGKIPNSQITSSTAYRPRVAAMKGRLNGAASWSARVRNKNQWIQIDLGRDEVVTAIATQGRANLNQWVTSYYVSYSLDGKVFVSYKTKGVVKVFRGNRNRNSIVKNVLSPSITARYVRIHPVSWARWISMRIELYGCYREYTSPCNTREVAFGVESGKIPNSQLTSSTAYRPRVAAMKGRLNGAASWTARVRNKNQWIQIDLGRDEAVTAIATQGRANLNQWVTSYYVSYSLDGKVFVSYKTKGVVKVFRGNSNRNSIVKNVLSPAITARYVRIHPLSWSRWISMRIELYGCYRAPKPCDSSPCKNEAVCENKGSSFACSCVGSYKGKTCEEYSSPCNTREVAFGVESGKIPNSQITSSTAYRPRVAAVQGRLNGAASWSARVRNKNQWIQIDLGRDEVVTAIATQGRANLNQWVTSYYVSYSLDGKVFISYKNEGIIKVFRGNSNRNSIVKNILSPAVTARYVRIHPVSWLRWISMRLELYGCYREPEPCDSSPCKNNGKCVNKEKSFSCICRPHFIGSKCGTELANPCKTQPCQNGGKCVVLGNRYSCRCKPQFGGVHCQHGLSLCSASGDPHYTSFDGLRFDFMGTCEYDFAKDCSVHKLFAVRTLNRRCGSAVSCTAAVKVYIVGYYIQFSRQRRTAIVNGVKISRFPIIRPGFKITNPSVKWLIMTTDIGLTVAWDTNMAIKVAVSGRFKGKTCSSSLCGNNNGKRLDDRQFSRKCAPPPAELICIPDSVTQPIINKCHLMNAVSSPFRPCNRVVDPTTLISNCKYDACRCTDPMQCVCASFARYSKQCAGYGSIVNWRFKATYLYAPLAECAQQCKSPGQIFNECGSSCAKTCRDLSSDTQCNEECIPGCQCPENEVLDENNRCVPVTKCPCLFQGAVYLPGQSMAVGNCKTCTCNAGSMACVDDRECKTKEPCESFPCKNDGICTEEGDTFSCRCSENYQGRTCEDLKPKPCDSQPCKNDGICANVGASFSCECASTYQGNTCEERSSSPCNPSPCKNGATCVDQGKKFSCKCSLNFIGATCETELQDPCENNPCKNAGVCVRLGNRYSCRCRPEFGGTRCEYSQSTCYAQGDPHYTSFDGKKFDFMGKCQYLFAQDCSENKLFTVYTKNLACGRGGASCTAAVTVILAAYRIHFNRVKRTAVINGVKYRNFPIVRPGFAIITPNARSLTLTADIGLTLTWDCNMNIKLTISGRYKNRICSSSLCGNNNGNWRDDNQFDRTCALPEGELVCFPTEENSPSIEKCQLMNDEGSPFKACNDVIDPTVLIANCKYDACRCKDAMQCVCSSFATYSKQCAAYGKVINWRFKGTYLYPALRACARQCKNAGEIFMECGLSCARSCRDLSRDIKCNEECVPGCQCPNGELLNDENRCVPASQCPCIYEEKVIQPGDSVSVGNCKTCTCNRGSMACVDDRVCESKGPCEIFPCKNGGVCSEEGSSFSCECPKDYQGKTCEKLKPKPCDSSPCKNGGICSNEGLSFSCECVGNYQGKTCEEERPKPCDSQPCHNGATCTNTEISFSCKCPPEFIGKLCDREPPNPCQPNPCQNDGRCETLGNSFSCQCKDNTFGGQRCEYTKATCGAHGDPHYTTFDMKRYDFQGPCSYVFAEDCSADKAFKVITTNVRCGGRGATCTAAVTVYLNGEEIRLTREARTVIINRIKIRKFPIKRPGFVIRNPSKSWLRLTVSVGLTVEWDSRTIVRVAVAGKYHGKMCGLCGNFNGDQSDDVPEMKPECIPPPDSLVCEPESATKKKYYMDLCNYMGMSTSPFAACNSAVNPSQLMKDCQYDACKCDNPMQCVCKSFAAYSQQCSDRGVVLKWRFQGTYLFPPLEKCVQQCSNPGEIFTECGSPCARNCRDLSANLACEEECVPGCQCPGGKLLNYAGVCVSAVRCPCEFRGTIVESGESVNVGNCTTCTCNKGAMTCVEDKECLNKGQCHSLPCKNGGICSSLDDGSFLCECTAEYQGETCKELKPTPCDSSPCKNDGICSNEGMMFSCECTRDYEGKTCEELKTRPCDSNPCQNGGICSNNGETFKCKCIGIYRGIACEEAKCEEKLDILLVADGSGSVRKSNFAKIKKFIQNLNTRLNIGPDRTQVALMQFGAPVKTRIEFNLGDKKTLEQVNQGVEEVKYLRSQTATGDALRKSGEVVFNGKGNDRPDAPNVLILFTDGQATDKQGKQYQVQQAKKLKDDGVKVITVAMGVKKTVDRFRDKLSEMASKASDSAAPLMFESEFQYLDMIANKLVKEVCDPSLAV